MYPHFPAGGGFGLSVPHTTQISPPLSNGAQIHVSGTPTGNRFEINLKSYQDDIVLHVNPRFDGNTLVINSAQRGSWGQEERHSLTLYRGARFTMVIMATDRSFKVAINNSHVCEFFQRSPMHLAQMVEVKGELTLDSVQVFPGQGAMGFPPAMGMGMGFAPPPPSFGGDMGYCPPPPQPSFGGGFGGGFGFPSAPPPPHGGPSFPGGSVPSIHSCRLHPGSRVFVRGTIHPGAQRFELNLLQGYSDGDDIAFHFNPRFDSRTIVKNHRRQGQWGSEENQPFPGYMPLMPGASIDLEIACHHDKYTVLMNGHVIAEYYHKIAAGSVAALQYKGDITINSVGQI